MDFNREAWERDRFGETRFHLPVPRRNVKPSLKIIRQDSVMSKAFPESIGKLIALSEMLGHTDDGAQVLTWTREEVERALRKLRQNPREFFKVEKEDVDDDQRRFYIQRPGAHTPISTTTAPRPTYGVVFSTLEGRRIDEGRWGCCWQAQEEPGCYFGYKDTRRNIPYTWFGGLKRFPRSEYDLVVRSSRGVVFLEDNLLASDDLHRSIVTTLTSSGVREAFFARSLAILHADETLEILWKVARWMHEYNDISKVPQGNFPALFDRDYMIEYLDKHLPRQFYPLLRDATMDSKLKEAIKRLKQQSELLLKKAYIEKNPWRRLDALIKRLEQYGDADLYNLSDVDLAADLQTADSLLQESAVFLDTAKVSTAEMDNDIFAWYNRLPKQNLSETDLNNIDALILIYRNGEDRHNDNVNALSNGSALPKQEMSWYKKLFATVRKFVTGSYKKVFEGVLSVNQSMSKIDELHAETVKNLKRYLQSYVNDLNDFRAPDMKAYQEQTQSLLKAYETLDTLTEQQSLLRNVYIKYANIEAAIQAFFKTHVSEITGKSLSTPASANERSKLSKYLEIAQSFREQPVVDLGKIDNDPNKAVVKALLDDIRTKDNVQNFQTYEIPPIKSLLQDGLLDTWPKLENVNRHIALIVKVAQRRDKPDSDFMNQIKELAKMVGAFKNDTWVTRWELIEEFQMTTVILKPGVQFIVRDLKPLDKTSQPDYFGHSFQIEHTIKYWDEFVGFLNRHEEYKVLQERFTRRLRVSENNILNSDYPGNAGKIPRTVAVYNALRQLRRKLKNSVPSPSFASTLDVVQAVTYALERWRLLVITGIDEKTSNKVGDRNCSLPLFQRRIIDHYAEKYGILQSSFKVPGLVKELQRDLEIYDQYVTHVALELTDHAYDDEELWEKIWGANNPQREWKFSAQTTNTLFQYSKALAVQLIKFIIDVTMFTIIGDESAYQEATKKNDDFLKRLKEYYASQMRTIAPLSIPNSVKNTLMSLEQSFEALYNKPNVSDWKDFLAIKLSNGKRFDESYKDLVSLVRDLNYTDENQRMWIQSLAFYTGLYSASQKTWRTSVTYDTNDKANIAIEMSTTPSYINNPALPEGYLPLRLEMVKVWTKSLAEFCQALRTLDYSIVKPSHGVTFIDKSGLFYSVYVPDNEKHPFRYQIGGNGPLFTLFECTEHSFRLWMKPSEFSISFKKMGMFKIQVLNQKDQKTAASLQRYVDMWSLTRVRLTDAITVENGNGIVPDFEQYARPIINVKD